MVHLIILCIMVWNTVDSMSVVVSISIQIINGIPISTHL